MNQGDKILVTGGAGFIGSHIVDKLVEIGYDVTIIDNLSSTKTKPDYLNPKANLIVGDIADYNLLMKIIPNVEVIFHLAASVGIAQSNYEMDSFTDNNCTGTAILLKAIVNSGKKPKLIVSTSNTTYGEGLYYCNKCQVNFHPKIRTNEEIEKYGFEPICDRCKSPSKSVPTDENTSLDCNSIYALNKKYQEESCLITGKLYGFPVVALKYFNVFGPRQSLNNPYTGVNAIFISRIKNNNPLIIYEDGLQTRDFISVHDVVEANILAMNNENASGKVFNIGSGKAITINELALKLYEIMGKEPKIGVNRLYRKGDIRHCIADNRKAKEFLNWEPKISFEEGLREIVKWSENEKAEDNFEKANRELKEKGLI
jgi:dTDP-L-rhamnose 4-epimerase